MSDPVADEGVPQQLPAHTPVCMGCGPDNPHGLQLTAYSDGPEVFADVTFGERHIGAPGLAHGGAIAAACATARVSLRAGVTIAGTNAGFAPPASR